MGKLCHNDAFDAMLDEIATSTIMTLCSQEPADRTEAVTTYALADVVMAGGDFTNADGDTNGRKVTVAAKSNVTVDATGTGNHVALCDATILMYVTTCTGKAVTASDEVNFPAWDIEVADPT